MVIKPKKVDLLHLILFPFFHVIKIIEFMYRTELLTKIDTCLKSYVEQNNTRYKSNIQTIFMTKQQLTNFYYEMQQGKFRENYQNRQKGLKEIKNNRRTYSGYVRKQSVEKQKLVLDWRNSKKVCMNQKSLIGNYQQQKDKLNDRQSCKQRKNKNQRNQLVLKMRREERCSKVNPDEIKQITQMKNLVQLQKLELFPDLRMSQCINQNGGDSMQGFEKQILSFANIEKQHKSLIGKQNFQSSTTKKIKQYIKQHQQKNNVHKNRIEAKKNEKNVKEQEIQSQYIVEMSQSELQQIKKSQKSNMRLKLKFKNYVQKKQEQDRELYQNNQYLAEYKYQCSKLSKQLNNAIQAYFVKKNGGKARSELKQQQNLLKYKKSSQRIKQQLREHFLNHRHRNIRFV